MPYTPVLLLCYAFAMFFTSCSVTKNLPEGEQLYTGIKSIEFGEKKKSNNDSTGVIKAIAETAETIDKLFTSSGNSSAPADTVVTDTLSEAKKKELREAEKARKEADKKSLETVKEEINGVLAYAPNNALFGSSSLRQPLAFGLWFYNGFVNSKSAIGKWIFKNFAKQPVLISTVNPELRTMVATNVLHNYGYFRGSADYELLPSEDNKKS